MDSRDGIFVRCGQVGCTQHALAHFRRVSSRRLTEDIHYCAEHAQDFLDQYFTAQATGDVVPERGANDAAFEIELLLYDQRPDKPCFLTLREVGGERLLNITTGPFEIAALGWELERTQMERPRTHRAIVSLMKALGGRLNYVVIDQFLPSEHIYEAKLKIEQLNTTVVVDVRPSDAVILALICEVPIFVSNEVLLKMEIGGHNTNYGRMGQ